MKFAKKNVLIVSLASLLALVTLVGGGTFAYLIGNTEDVVNNFNSNQVTVSISETTGYEYDIVPGTSQSKDPKITVNNTAAAYLYSIIIDNTDGLVGYEVEDGWTLLSGWDTKHMKVYYREVEADAIEKTFSVLKNDQVTYDAAIENSDMLNSDGTLKSGINLSFSAYAIQKDGFADALAAFEYSYSKVSSSDELSSAIESGKKAVMTADISLPESMRMSGEVYIFGNGYDLISPDGDSQRVIDVNGETEPVVLNIKDVNLVGPRTGTYTRGISVYDSSDVILNIEDSAVSATYYAINIASANENVEINVKNTVITGWAAFQTHSPYTKVTFENCTLIGINDKQYDPIWNGFATVVINEYSDGNPDPLGAHDGVFTFKDCRIEATQTTGNEQRLLSVRAENTTVNIENCVFFVDGVQIPIEDIANYVSVRPNVIDSFVCNIK
ncbi:MAG: hypothetical protein KHW62_02385 [Clostridiales bacterium]|nr:hypothetical protein [Clostridiales bacterium]